MLYFNKGWSILTWPQRTVVFDQQFFPDVLMDFSVTGPHFAGIQWNKFFIFILIVAGMPPVSVQATNHWIWREAVHVGNHSEMLLQAISLVFWMVCP